MERYIMHCDINHCFAQIHEMMHPQLRDVPMVIGGSEDLRNGIVLARNQKARQYKIKTAQTLREARALCPNLLVIPPNYDYYRYYSELVKDIYREYSDQVESFGIDEAWTDLTNSTKLFGDPISIAKTIQKRVYEEIGLTVSVGLSFNKIFAKLGSDLIKPSGFVVINKDNYKDIVFPLPVSELLNVGSKTAEKLNKIDIYTIGDLANSNIELIEKLLGKNGTMIWCFANGLEYSEVNHKAYVREVKSVGNGITTHRDINNYTELKLVFYVLVESVASRLKDLNLSAKTISISIRDKSLKSFTKQTTLLNPTNTSDVIIKAVMELAYDSRVFNEPIRSISVKASKLVEDNFMFQLNLFESSDHLEKAKKIDETVDLIRNKYGFNSIKRACILLDEQLTDFNPKGEHITFPLGFY